MRRLLFYNIIFVLSLFVFLTSFSEVSAESVTRRSRVGENITGIGTVAWTNPENITNINESFATAVDIPAGGGVTNYLRGTDYRFGSIPIPEDAFIKGISLQIRRYSSSDGTGQRVRDHIVSLLKDGVITGDNKATTSLNWPVAFATRTYGGQEDLWGTTWTPADINTTTFGAVLVASNNHATLVRTGTVDFLRITIYYFRTTTLEVGQTTGTFGGSVNLTATLTPAVSDKVITFSLNGSEVGTSTTDVNGVAVLNNISISGIDAGSYPTGVEVNFDGDDYYVSSSHSNILHINAKPVTVTVDAKTKFAAEPDPVFTYTVSDTSTVFTGALSRVPGEKIGSYEIQQGSLAVVGSNYVIDNFVSAVLTINSRGGSNLPVGFNLPPVAPPGGFSINIEGDTQNIFNRLIKLNLNGGSAARVAISNFSDFRNASQILYSPSIEWDICEGKEICASGVNKIYVKFFTQYGYSSETIIYEVNYRGNDMVAQKVITDNNQASIISLINSVSFGQRNEKVRELQTELRKLGFFSYSSDTGFYSVITRQAIVDYLISIKTEGLETLIKMIKYGERSATVREIQTQLKGLGFFTYPTATGFYGPITRDAINSFLK